MKILVIAAHPDDEVLGCGGTIARLVSEGHTVRIGILGEGWTARFAARTDANQADVETLHRRSEDAARLLGAPGVRFGGLPDNRFDSVPLLDVVKILEQWISEERPTRIYTQHGGDLNVDHAVTYRATLTATRPLPDFCVRELLAYEVASSTEWAFGSFEPVFRPNLFVDISSTLERKVGAMALYESEMRRFPHPRSAESIRASAQRWGATTGVAAAEAFEIVRAIV